MDEIRIDNLEVYAHHGVFPEENEKGQPFFVNMVLYTDTRKAGLQDELMLSTHYGEVCHTVHEYMTKNTFKLIETVAEGIAKAVLVIYPLVQGIDVEVRKPQAPIGLPFESVSVKIHRGWHTAFVAIGSNMGERENYIAQAVEMIGNQAECKVEHCSSILRTSPYGVEDQEEFLNGVMQITTLLKPQELLTFLQEIEKNAKRERLLHWGPRTLDLDIIFYDDIILDTESLTIPHIDMQNRDFVLQPLAEIAGYYRHPILGKTVNQMLAEVKEVERHVLD